MRRRTVLITSLVAVAALPSTALADVFVEVPIPLLGGPIWKPISIAPTPEPAGRPSLAPPSEPPRARHDGAHASATGA